MDDLIKLVKTYRFSVGFTERVRLAEEIFRRIEPDLRLFVISRLAPQHAQDVLQEVLIAVATSLKTFQGDEEKQFWKWCYRIACNKVHDQVRKEMAGKIQFMPPEDLWQMMDLSAQDAPMSPATRHDLEHVMRLLSASQPECFNFLWSHFVFGLDYTDIAEEQNLNYDAVRMKIGRCLEAAKSLVA